MRNHKVIKDSSSHRENHQFDSIAHAVCVVLSLALVICGITSLIFGDLAAAVLSIFFSVVFAILSFKIRRVKLKAGLFEVEAHFK